jgi:hypothetical protein
MFRIIILIVLFPFTGCKTPAMQSSANTHIYWINSWKRPCTGVGPMTCLQVQKDSFQEGKWMNFYGQIEGFTYEPGYRYKIEVSETQIPAAQVPADGSSIRHTLVRILEKEPDPRWAIHDIWVLESIGQDAWTGDASGGQRPYVEFHVTDNLVLGHDGCGRFEGKLNLDSWPAIQVTDLTSSSEGCMNQAAVTRFRHALISARGFHRENMFLVLTDADGKTCARFRKTD